MEQASYQNKKLVVVADDTPIKLDAYDPDTMTDFSIETNVKSAKYIFNHSEYILDKFGKLDSFQTYVIAKGLSQEIINAVLLQGYFETNDQIKQEKKLVLYLERRK